MRYSFIPSNRLSPVNKRKLSYSLRKTNAFFRNLVGLSLVVFVFIVFILSTASCKSAESGTKSTANQSGAPATTSTALPSSTNPVTTTTVKPKLEQVTFSLSLKPEEQYKEYTLPIYLTSKTILHMTWTISGEGENIRMAITTPGGQYVGIKEDGTFNTMSPNDPCDLLFRSGSIILRPSEQEWTSGFYIFHAHIIASDPSISGKILYWTEY